jgi:hypothetical protein
VLQARDACRALSASASSGATSAAQVQLPEIDANGLSFWAGGHVSEGEAALRPLERERVKLWLGKSYAGLDALGDQV